MARRSVIAYGKEYESYVLLSSDYDVDYQELMRYIHRGLPPEEAIASCKDPNRRRRKNTPITYTVRNVEYESLAEACRRMGISTGSVYSRRAKIIAGRELTEKRIHKITEQVLEQLSVKQIKRRVRGTDGVTVADTTYPSRQAALRAYHLSTATVNARIERARRNGQELTFEEAVLLGRNRRYAAAEYGTGPMSPQQYQVDILQYLLAELEREYFVGAVDCNELRLGAVRHWGDDIAEIRLLISWVTDRLLSVCNSQFAPADLWGGRGAAAGAINQINSRYAGIKLYLMDSGMVGATCDIFACDASMSSKRAAMAAVRQFIETSNMILAQAGGGA